jgi:hypothetical protein
MKFNNDPEWLRKRAEAEDGYDCTVGLSPRWPNEAQLAWLFRMRAEGREIRVKVPAGVIGQIDKTSGA